MLFSFSLSDLIKIFIKNLFLRLEKSRKIYELLEKFQKKKQKKSMRYDNMDVWLERSNETLLWLKSSILNSIFMASIK